jgi:hypothetical protein
MADTAPFGASARAISRAYQSLPSCSHCSSNSRTKPLGVASQRHLGNVIGPGWPAFLSATSPATPSDCSAGGDQSPAAGDHQNCAVKFNLSEWPIPIAEAARRYGAPYAAFATFEPPAVDGPLEVLERHSCVYQGRRFGHVVCRYRRTITSLFVTEGVPPTSPELEPNDVGPAVASLPAGRFVGFVVAGLDRVLRLAQTLAEPLSRHLA